MTPEQRLPPLPNRMATAVALLTAAACTGGPTIPQRPGELVFDVQAVDLGGDRSGEVVLSNVGGQALGPVELVPGPVQGGTGTAMVGSTLAADPGTIATLNPGDERVVGLSLSLDGSLAPGRYSTLLTAQVGTASRALLAVDFTVLGESDASVAAVRIVRAPTSLRAGDVVQLEAEVRDTAGAPLPDASVSWTVTPGLGGYVDGDGRFVGYAQGAVTLVARVGSAADTVDATVTARGLSGSFSVAREGRVDDRVTSDLWLHGDAAYTGTWGSRTVGSVTRFGNTLYAWDVSGTGPPVRTAAIEVDASTVNDVKVRADGALAVITHERSNDALNGVTILDLSDPLVPEPIGRFTDELQPGVHNVWVEGDYAYLVVDMPQSGLRILDISDPANPTVVARFYGGASFLHDVYVRDGLAFLSHWNAGLIVLDVGNGIAGGTPEAPVEVSRLSDLGGETHNAWYWPEAGYVFVGEEDTATPGIMHVVDARDLTDLREVATYRVEGQTPHNFWLDEESAVLYAAWYGNGLRALDVSGELIGELGRQGREIASALYDGPSTRSWAPQLHGGLVWVSDMGGGLFGLQPSF